MKIKLLARGSLSAGLLELNAQNLRVKQGEKILKSQWIPMGERGILLVETPGEGFYELEAEEIPAVRLPECKRVFDGAFPVFENIAGFCDGATGIVIPEHEKELPAGRTYTLAFDRAPVVRSSVCGTLAEVVEISSVCCDEQGKPSPVSASAVYTWIFCEQATLVVARIRCAPGKYAYRFLAPVMQGRKRYVGGEPLLEGETSQTTALRFDGFAAVTDGDNWVGVYGASAFVLPDCIAAGSVDKECCNYGEEFCSAWLYTGKNEEMARGFVRSLPTDCRLRLVREDSCREYASGETVLRFYKTDSGAVWQAQTSAFSSAQSESVFTIKNAEGEWDSVSGWNSVRFLPDSVVFEGRRDNAAARAELAISSREKGFALSLTVNAPKISRVCFPNINVSCEGVANVFVPSCSGKLEKDVFRRDFYYRESYAGPFANMSFLGPIDGEGNGFYICWEGEGERREYNVTSCSLSASVRISAALWPENLGVTDNYCSPVVAVLATRNGWRGMCREYRSYTENTPWLRRRTRAKGATMEENRFWLWSHFRWDDEHGVRYTEEQSIENWLQVIDQVACRMKAKLGVMAYDWQATVPIAYREDLFPHSEGEKMAGGVSDNISIQGNITHPEIGTNYMPHYLPAKKGFTEAVQVLHKKGITVIPYMDNRLWDPRDGLLGNFEINWENTGKALSCKDAHGEPYMEYYCHHLPDGTPANTAVVCPFTQKWQDIMTDTVVGLVEDCGVDGVYLDQIAATAPALCMDSSHGHPVGGGIWWREGYESMLAKMRAKVPRALLTTECEAEPYMADHDAYLSWTHVLPDQVPAFSAVYSDKIVQYGRTPVAFCADYPDVESVHEVRASYAQSYLFGEQLGFMFMRAMLTCGDRLIPFLDRLVSEREMLTEYFNRGELTDMPEMISEREICYLWGRDLRPVCLPRVLSAIWSLNGKYKLLMVNPFNEAGTAKWLPKKGQFGYGKKLKVEGQACDGKEPLCFAVQPQEVLTFDLEADD